MITFVSKGCTHAVDEAITSARLRYSQEREDFHSFFPNMTTLQVRHMLRGQQRSDTRREVVLSLFEAQQASRHDLWTLLLVQACEAKLVERRLAVSEAYDAQLDQLVFDTFVDALSDIPHDLELEDIQLHVLRTSARAFTKALHREHGTTRVERLRAAQHASRVRQVFRQTHLRLARLAD
jgi:hypothetical protein